MSQSSPIETSTMAPSPSEAKENNDNNDATFSLQVVSPSVGVPTLEFHQLSVYTQVKELKALIRDSLQSNPSDEQQRLIHRGRMLARETETMVEIFGEEMLKVSGFHILHLVLRNFPENMVSRSNSSSATEVVSNESPHSAVSPVPRYNLSQRFQITSVLRNQRHQNNLRQIQAASNLVGQRLQQQQNQENNATVAQGTLRTNSNASQLNGLGTQNPSTIPSQGAPLINHSAEITSIQNFIAQQQRQRLRSAERHQNFPQREYPAQGVNGTTSNQIDPNLRRPDQSTIYIREGFGPNGDRWQVTVNATTTTIPLLPGQPRHQTHQIERNHNLPNVSPTSSNPHMSQDTHDQIPRIEPNIQINRAHPQSTSSFTTLGTGSLPQISNTNNSLNSTPFFPLSSPSTFNANESGRADYPTHNTPTPNEPLVYILSSHTGPRAILISNAQTFYTPLRNPIRHRPTFVPPVDQGVFLEHRIRTPVRRAVRERRNPNENLPDPALPHANVRVGGMGAQIAQTLWLIARLVGFVWFFTTGNPSWTRWLMVNGLAFIIFIMYTGIFNGTAEQFWNPIRRHLDALIPLGPPNPQNAPVIPNGARMPVGNEDRHRPRTVLATGSGENNARRRGELDPAEVAARILEQQRRTNDNWILSHVRRLEQALLLFIASLVPGIGERHIAHREEVANRQAERQQALEAATESATQVENDESSANAASNQTEIENQLREAETNSTEIPQNQSDTDTHETQQ
ncbi:hypothetical protein K3495_g5389 [Podosphaera aphanis]|nr:hypothetical protein K3495_g5389 [Podosphaera aphanis]